MSDTKSGPMPPYGVGPLHNCKRVGWHAFFGGRGRENCPFPISRRDLQKGFREGWDAAQAWAP